MTDVQDLPFNQDDPITVTFVQSLGPGSTVQPDDIEFGEHGVTVTYVVEDTSVDYHYKLFTPWWNVKSIWQNKEVAH